MAILTITQRARWLVLPHYVEINGQMLGIMKGRSVSLKIPAGLYVVTIRSLYKFIATSTAVEVKEHGSSTVTFGDREKWWNVLFNLDIALWIVKRFVSLGEPWDTIYEALSNGFFLIWLVRLWVIRKRYFKMEVDYTERPKKAKI